MSIGRISTNYAFIRSMNTLTDTFKTMDSLREKMNTGKEINRPSDDPLGMHQVFKLGTSLKENVQYQDNIDVAMRRYNTVTATLTSVEDILLEMRELALSLSTDAASSAERSAAANEIEILLEELVQLANTKHQGKFIFGGTNTLSGTASQSAAYNIQYDANGIISSVVPNPRGINNLVYTTILPGTRETLNISGAAPFQPNGSKGSGDIFNAMVSLRSNLLSNDLAAIKQSEVAIASAIEQVTEQNTIIGAKTIRLEISKETLEAAHTNEVEEKSAVEDSDYAALLLKYSTAEVLLNSALSSTASLLQNSLLNFI